MRISDWSSDVCSSDLGELNDQGVPLCGDQNDVALRGDRKLGYLAPPLYGVWSTAPYFHNGSVPNLWEVLKPSERKQIWRRTSAPPIDGGIRGLDYSLATGYDRNSIGWTYEAVNYGPGCLPLFDCTPVGGQTFQDLVGLVWGDGK